MTLPILTGLPDLAGRKVTVMGLGLFGGGVVTDLKSEEALRESVEELRSLPVELRLGRHEDRDFRDADLVIVNPAVPPESPYLRGVKAVETEMNLFLKRCRAEMIVGITGSNGKSTTTTLIREVLKHH